MIVPMDRIRIVGPRAAVDGCIWLLNKNGALHVVNSRNDGFLAESALSVGAFSRETSETLKRAESLLFDVRTAIALLKKSEPSHIDMLSVEPMQRDWVSGAFYDEHKAMVDEITAAADGARRLNGVLEEIRLFRMIFEEFQPLVEVVVSLKGVEMSGVFFRENEKEAAERMDEIEMALDAATGGACSMIRGKPQKALSSCLLVYPFSLRDRVQKEVFERHTKKIQTVHVPRKLEKETFAATLLNMFKKEKTIKRELKKLQEKLHGFSVRWKSLLGMVEKGLERTVKELRLQNYLAFSEKTFWITGWIPASESQKLEEAINHEFGGEALVYTEKPSPAEYENVPVMLKNPSWAKPFQRFLAIFPSPVYGSLDPTPFIAVFFPIFFGLMLGDVGYALILGGLARFIYVRKPGDPLWSDVMAIVVACAFTTAVFGLVFGEFFGKLWYGMGLPSALFHRKEQIIPFLAATLLFGGLHVIIGNILALRNSLYGRMFREALAKLSDIGIVGSSFWVAYCIYSAKPFDAGAAVMAASLVVKLAVGGAMGILETMRLFSNVLSYARLMAIGMASIIFADMADDFFLSASSVVIGVIGAMAIHSINFVLGVFGPTIQAIRLHYVEFFSQFYKHGSVEYAPLKAEKV